MRTAGDEAAARRELELAREGAARVADEEDRDHLLEALETIRL
jgi:hypothetical protein